MSVQLLRVGLVPSYMFQLTWPRLRAAYALLMVGVARHGIMAPGGSAQRLVRLWSWRFDHAARRLGARQR